MNLSPAECRAARANLGWTVTELAFRSGVSPLTIRLFEAGERDTLPETIAKLAHAMGAKPGKAGNKTALGLTPAECRVGRALLGWSLDTFAEKAGLDRQTIFRFEHERQEAGPVTAVKLRRALDEGGVEFGEDGWIRLRPATQESSQP